MVFRISMGRIMAKKETSREKTLTLLEKNRGTYISGEEIAEQLQISRNSVWKAVRALRKEGYKVSERLLSIDELAEAMENGTLKEAWGCGTAAVISPIGELCYKDKKYTINNGEIGKITHHLYDTLTGIQWGKAEDTYGWTYRLD